MKVLYTDLICPSGHVFYNNIQISFIIKKHDVDFIFQKGYADKLNIPNGCKVLEIEPFHRGTNVIVDALRYRVYMWKYQRYIAKVAQQGGYDLIFVSSFETFSFCLTLPYRCPVVAVCHNNIDYILSNRVKRFLFKRASYKVQFVALNRATSDYFMEKGIKHILNSHGTIVQMRKNIVENFVFMPANDCLDTKTLQFLQSECFLDALHNLGLKFYIKEKYISISHPCIVKLPNFIEQDIFEDYMNRALAIILPYDINKYKYRSSGLFYEAVGRNKAIIAPDNLNFRSEVCENDSGIFLYDGLNDIPGILEKVIDLGGKITYDGLLVKMVTDINKLF